MQISVAVPTGARRFQWRPRRAIGSFSRGTAFPLPSKGFLGGLGQSYDPTINAGEAIDFSGNTIAGSYQWGDVDANGNVTQNGRVVGAIQHGAFVPAAGLSPNVNLFSSAVTATPGYATPALTSRTADTSGTLGPGFLPAAAVVPAPATSWFDQSTSIAGYTIKNSTLALGGGALAAIALMMAGKKKR